jgi:hypothetical protein
MLTDVALVVAQVSVDDCPAVMLAGFAVNVIPGGAGAVLTVTVTLAVEFPPGPVAAKTYVVVVAGDLVIVPLLAMAAPSSVAMVVSVVLQVSVTGCPGATVVGFAENAMVGGAAACASCEATSPLPPQPAAIKTKLAIKESFRNCDEEFIPGAPMQKLLLTAA